MHSSGHGHQTRVISIDECHTIAQRPEVIQKRSLLPRDTVERTEELQMFATDPGHQPVRRFEDLAQCADLPGVIGANLDDRDLVPPVKTEQRKRDTDLVVQVPLGC